MGNNILEYKGYHTKIEFDIETHTLRGKIEGIGDLVNFSSQSLDDIEKEFHSAVDDYLEFCKELGKEPDKEYKGTFNIRIAPKLHKKLALEAYKQDESLNAMVEKAIEEYLNKGVQEEKGKTIYIVADGLSFKQKGIGNLKMSYKDAYSEGVSS